MAQLSHAQAELDLRSLQVRRLERLADEEAVPLSQLLEALQEERKARANLEKARACLRKLIR
jgi:multidrug resistance efflux pump